MKKLIALPQTTEQLAALKAVVKALNVDFRIEKMDETDRVLANPAMVKRLNESMQQVKEGKVIKINPADIWNL